MKLSNLIKSTVALAAGACILTGCSDDKPEPANPLLSNVGSVPAPTAAQFAAAVNGGSFAIVSATGAASAVTGTTVSATEAGGNVTFTAGSSSLVFEYEQIGNSASFGFISGTGLFSSVTTGVGSTNFHDGGGFFTFSGTNSATFNIFLNAGTNTTGLASSAANSPGQTIGQIVGSISK